MGEMAWKSRTYPQPRSARGIWLTMRQQIYRSVNYSDRERRGGVWTWRRGPQSLYFGPVLLLARFSSAFGHQGQLPSPAINKTLGKEMFMLLVPAGRPETPPSEKRGTTRKSKTCSLGSDTRTIYQFIKIFPSQQGTNNLLRRIYGPSLTPQICKAKPKKQSGPDSSWSAGN